MQRYIQISRHPSLYVILLNSPIVSCFKRWVFQLTRELSNQMDELGHSLGRLRVRRSSSDAERRTFAPPPSYPSLASTSNSVKEDTTTKSIPTTAQNDVDKVPPLSENKPAPIIVSASSFQCGCTKIWFYIKFVEAQSENILARARTLLIGPFYDMTNQWTPLSLFHDVL